MEGKALADRFLKMGNYLEAKSIYENLLKSELEIRNRITLENKIKKCSELHNRLLTNLEIGEAQFPLYHQDDKIATIEILSIREEALPEEVILPIDNVKDIISMQLDSIIEESVKKFLILDWKLNDLVCTVKQKPKRNSHIPSVNENSYELAAGLAIISYILKIPVDSEYVFTGALSIERKKPVVSFVNHIDAKHHAVKSERPNCLKFFFPERSDYLTNGVATPCLELSEVIEDVFTNFEDSIERVLYQYAENSELRILSMKQLDYQDDKSRPINLYVFGYPQDIEDLEIQIFFKYLERNISPILRASDKPIVIDGLRYAVLLPFLLSTQEMKNSLSMPLAVRFSVPKFGTLAKACVVKVPNSYKGNLKIGDIIEYVDPKSSTPRS